MLPILTSEQMRRADRKAIREFGLPGAVLMEHAALALLHGVMSIAESRSLLPDNIFLVILCGGGNNGGDGLALARLASIQGIRSLVVRTFDPSDLAGDARLQWDVLQSISSVDIVTTETFLNQVEEFKSFHSSIIVVDGLLGTGSKGAPRPPMDRLIGAINRIEGTTIAVDIPSGLNADSGEVQSVAIHADHTITMSALKPGLLLRDGPTYSGSIQIAELGVPDEIYQDSGVRLLDLETAQEGLPVPNRQQQKYDRGSVLVVAGSRGMTGAAILAASAAMHSGAGLVRLALPERLYSSLLSSVPHEIMTHPMDGDRDHFAMEDVEDIIELLDRTDVLAIGPGLGRDQSTIDLVRTIVATWDGVILIDADGLSAFNTQLDLLKASPARIIITPHHGEMAKLAGVEREAVSSDVLDWVLRAEKASGACVVLKGAPTVVTSGMGNTWINGAGNPGMATAGSGDTLAGVISGLLPTRRERQEWEADEERTRIESRVLAGVYIHSLAGDLAALAETEYSMSAQSIQNHLAQAFSIVSDRTSQ